MQFRTRTCDHFNDFLDRAQLLTQKVLIQGNFLLGCWSHCYKNSMVVITNWLTITKYLFLKWKKIFCLLCTFFFPLSLTRLLLTMRHTASVLQETGTAYSYTASVLQETGTAYSYTASVLQEAGTAYSYLIARQWNWCIQIGRRYANWCVPHIWHDLFTDESRFYIDFMMVAHEIGDRRMNGLQTVLLLIMIDSMKALWCFREGGISYEGCTDLYVIRNRSVTGVSYRDEILVSIIRPYSDAVSNDFILMDDNAKPHHPRVAKF
jgi:hypothetical protein